MNNCKYSVLIVSSMEPSHFSGMGADMVDSLSKQGCAVDYLTRYETGEDYVIGFGPAPNKHHDSIANFVKQSKTAALLARRFLNVYTKIKGPKDNYIRGNGTTIVNPDEYSPVYSNEQLLSKIKKQYDFVIVFVWQDMITAVSIRAIYDYLHVPILLVSPDMQTFTGGCYYFGECRNFTHECGCCPVLGTNDPNDLTHRNFIAKKEAFTGIPVAFMANTHVNRFAQMSNLFPNNRIYYCPAPFNEREYIPLDAIECRRYFQIPKEKQFVIFSRFAGLKFKVKGYDYLLEAINSFANNLSDAQRSKILLVFAGTWDDNYEKQFAVDVKNVGLLDRNSLIKMYSAASVFVSSSIDDAGPSMVNQSMMCGTPVVSFEIGSAIDLTENGVTGYKAKMKDPMDFAKGLEMVFSLDDEDYRKMKNNCRKKAIEHNSQEAFAKRILNIYNNIIKD